MTLTQEPAAIRIGIDPVDLKEAGQSLSVGVGTPEVLSCAASLMQHANPTCLNVRLLKTGIKSAPSRERFTTQQRDTEKPGSNR